MGFQEEEPHDKVANKVLLHKGYTVLKFKRCNIEKLPDEFLKNNGSETKDDKGQNKER